VVVTLRRAQSHVELRVADDGIGIAPEFLPYVFERFHQADTSASRGAGGLGLGLAIVRQLVELHGGHVKVESAGRGKGAAFTVALPLGALRPVAGVRPVDSDRAASLEHVVILLVEDDDDNREVLRHLLEQHRAQVLAAGSAAEALAILQTSRPSVLVSDIGLPEIDGYELIQRMRNGDSPNRRIPAIALTARATADDRTRALRAGYQAHLAKPVEPSELVATIVSLTKLVSAEPLPTAC
jgi:CheY-like chemotaxis protein